MKLHSRKGSFLFICLQLLMYAAFLFLDLTGGSTTISSYIKFMVIILCFCYALFAKRGADKSILFLMKAGLFFTVISDLLILILDVYFYGVLTFIIVQQFYGIRISRENYLLRGEETSKGIGRSFVRRILLQLLVSFTICSILAFYNVELEPLLMASVFYFISIAMNTFVSVKTALSYPNSKSMRMFAIGMFLFLLCDINVGLFNLSGFISMSQSTYSVIYGISSILMWTFYAPSQVILALSTRSSMK